MTSSGSEGKCLGFHMWEPTEISSLSGLPGPGPVSASLPALRRDISRLCSDWLDHDVATPALLYHKEPAQDTQSSLIGAFLAFCCVFIVNGIRVPYNRTSRRQEMPLVVGFGCISLDLYSIRELG